MVERRTLTPLVLVRIQVPQPIDFISFFLANLHFWLSFVCKLCKLRFLEKSNSLFLLSFNSKTTVHVPNLSASAVCQNASMLHYSIDLHVTETGWEADIRPKAVDETVQAGSRTSSGLPNHRDIASAAAAS